MDHRADEALLEAFARGGDRGALAELVRRRAGALYGLAWHVLGNSHDAEDAVQETLVKVLREAAQYRPGWPARAWLHRVALNAALNVGRARRRRAAREQPRELRMEPAKEAPADRRLEVSEHVRVAVGRLPDAWRLPIVLHYFQGLSVAEAADALGQPRGTVLSNLHRGRERLRAELTELGGALAVLPLPALESALGAVRAPQMPAGLAARVESAARAATEQPAGSAATAAAAASAPAKGGLLMKLIGGLVLAGGVAGVLAAAVGQASPGESAAKPLPPPPFEVLKAKDWPGWITEHVAFTYGHAGRPVGGPARWAVGGVLPGACHPADQADRLYTGEKDSDVRIYFSDQRRRVWLLEKGEIWPIAGADDLGEEDGPGPYARFLYSGVYGGGHSGMVASGYTAYMADNGWLRRIRRQEDGSWLVETVAGKGSKGLAAGQTGQLSDLGRLGKGLAMDASGNLYFTLGGGLVKADPEGKVSWLITPDKVRKDMAEVYAKKWPEAKAPGVSLGQGEGVGLHAHTDGSVFGGGRTWPSTWKVTADGKFVPLINYAPKDKVIPNARWGPGDPACYQPHCCMGWGVTSEGYVWHQNEIPFARSRYEFDKNQVTVLDADMTWKLQPPDYRGFFKLPSAMGMNGECTRGEGNAPGPFHGRSSWVRIRKTAK